MVESAANQVPAKPIDLSVSRSLSELVSARDKHCFFNAVRAFFQMQDAAEALYIEGYAFNPELGRFAHGWVETATAIVDPTPCYCDGEIRLRYSGVMKLKHEEVYGRLFGANRWERDRAIGSGYIYARVSALGWYGLPFLLGLSPNGR